jgi:tRNA(fMet)-specific endonuclease VapC
LKYLLDSNAWIAVFRQKSASLLNELKRRPADEIVLCSVVLAELWYGVCRCAPAHRTANQNLVDAIRATYVSLPFDDIAALNAAELRAQLATAGQQIGPHDLMIAGIARTRNLTLVTNNVTEFQRVPGLLLENWQTP